MRAGEARGGAAAPANDNAAGRPSPHVRVARGRTKAVYACSEGVILPLRFAERMDGWRPASWGAARPERA